MPDNDSSPVVPDVQEGFDPQRGKREQVFERIQIANGCVVTKCGGCMGIVCANYFSDNCVCMDDYEAALVSRAKSESPHV